MVKVEVHRLAAVADAEDGCKHFLEWQEMHAEAGTGGPWLREEVDTTPGVLFQPIVVILKDLKPGTAYTVRVVLRRNGTEVAASLGVVGRTPTEDSTVLSKPGNPELVKEDLSSAIVNSTYDSVSVTWTPSPGAVEYLVRVCKWGMVANEEVKVFHTKNTAAVVNGLEGGTKYYVYVSTLQFGSDAEMTAEPLEVRTLSAPDASKRLGEVVKLWSSAVRKSRQMERLAHEAGISQTACMVENAHKVYAHVQTINAAFAELGSDNDKAADGSTAATAAATDHVGSELAGKLRDKYSLPELKKKYMSAPDHFDASDYEAARALLRGALDDLSAAIALLSKVASDVKTENKRVLETHGALRVAATTATRDGAQALAKATVAREELEKLRVAATAAARAYEARVAEAEALRTAAAAERDSALKAVATVEAERDELRERVRVAESDRARDVLLDVAESEPKTGDGASGTRCAAADSETAVSEAPSSDLKQQELLEELDSVKAKLQAAVARQHRLDEQLADTAAARDAALRKLQETAKRLSTPKVAVTEAAASARDHPASVDAAGDAGTGDLSPQLARANATIKSLAEAKAQLSSALFIAQAERDSTMKTLEKAAKSRADAIAAVQEALSSEMTTIEVERATALAECQALTSKLSAATAARKYAEAERDKHAAALSTQLDDTTTQIQSSQKLVKQLQAEVAASQAAVAEAAEHKRQSAKEQQRLRAALEESVENLDKSRKVEDGLRTALRQAQAANEQLKSSAASERDAANAEATRLTSELHQATEEKLAVQSELNDLKSQLESSREEIEHGREASAKAEQDLEEKAEEISRLSGRLETALDEATAAKEAHDGVKEELCWYVEENERLTEYAVRRDNERNALEETLGELQREVEELRSAGRSRVEHHRVDSYRDGKALHGAGSKKGTQAAAHPRMRGRSVASAPELEPRTPRMPPSSGHEDTVSSPPAAQSHAAAVPPARPPAVPSAASSTRMQDTADLDEDEWLSDGDDGDARSRKFFENLSWDSDKVDAAVQRVQTLCDKGYGADIKIVHEAIAKHSDLDSEFSEDQQVQYIVQVQAESMSAAASGEAW